jgi:hypothetical protein
MLGQRRLMVGLVVAHSHRDVVVIGGGQLLVVDIRLVVQRHTVLVLAQCHLVMGLLDRSGLNLGEGVQHRDYLAAPPWCPCWTHGPRCPLSSFGPSEVRAPAVGFAHAGAERSGLY